MFKVHIAALIAEKTDRRVMSIRLFCCDCEPMLRGVTRLDSISRSVAKFGLEVC
jgi:hypothetical protein